MERSWIIIVQRTNPKKRNKFSIRFSFMFSFRSAERARDVCAAAAFNGCFLMSYWLIWISTFRLGFMPIWTHNSHQTNSHCSEWKSVADARCAMLGVGAAAVHWPFVSDSLCGVHFHDRKTLLFLYSNRWWSVGTLTHFAIFGVESSSKTATILITTAAAAAAAASGPNTRSNNILSAN